MRIISRKILVNLTQLLLFHFEPNTHLTVPYIYFPSSSKPHFQRTLSRKIFFKYDDIPDLITLSTTFPPEKIVDFLWLLKSMFPDRIVPLIFIVDWSHPLSHVLGTTWGNKVGILHALSSQQEVDATLDRLINPSDYNDTLPKKESYAGKD